MGCSTQGLHPTLPPAAAPPSLICATWLTRRCSLDVCHVFDMCDVTWLIHYVTCDSMWECLIHSIMSHSLNHVSFTQSCLIHSIICDVWHRSFMPHTLYHVSFTKSYLFHFISSHSLHHTSCVASQFHDSFTLSCLIHMFCVCHLALPHPHLYVLHDSSGASTCVGVQRWHTLIYVCDMTHPTFWHASYVWHYCDMTHSHVWHYCDMTHSCVWHYCDMTHSHVWHYCDMTHSHVWCVPVLYQFTNVMCHVCDVRHHCGLLHVLDSHIHDWYVCISVMSQMK